MERPYAYIKKWLLTDIFSYRYGPIPKIYVLFDFFYYTMKYSFISAL